MGVTFLPYLEKSMEVMRALIGYFHEDVRQNLVKALRSLLLVSFKAHSAPLRQAGGAPASSCQSCACIYHQVSHALSTTLFLSVHNCLDDSEPELQACELLCPVWRQFLDGHGFIH
jgi:hypothetical protein